MERVERAQGLMGPRQLTSAPGLPGRLMQPWDLCMPNSYAEKSFQIVVSALNTTSEDRNSPGKQYMIVEIFLRG